MSFVALTAFVTVKDKDGTVHHRFQNGKQGSTPAERDFLCIFPLNKGTVSIGGHCPCLLRSASIFESGHVPILIPTCLRAEPVFLFSHRQQQSAKPTNQPTSINHIHNTIINNNQHHHHHKQQQQQQTATATATP